MELASPSALELIRSSRLFTRNLLKTPYSTVENINKQLQVKQKQFNHALDKAKADAAFAESMRSADLGTINNLLTEKCLKRGECIVKYKKNTEQYKKQINELQNAVKEIQTKEFESCLRKFEVAWATIVFPQPCEPVRRTPPGSAIVIF